MLSYAKFSDKLKYNLQVRQLYCIEYEMNSIDEVLLDRQEGEVSEEEEEEEETIQEDRYYYYPDSDDNDLDGDKYKKESGDDYVAVQDYDLTPTLHSPCPGLHLCTCEERANYIQSLITEPRFRISQSISEKIRNRKLSLIRVNTI
ncbi:hypothetical protein I9W82_000233 [Candida metapsilosis]|uniref:Uncharacterized protein n=1 Tax=Candida metapsilosis TaxID=273372 RepID=A0A8H7ZKC4_9ASCO|nr:hypothetical protein I9W82_000233 [Candida metapsilosis]